MSAERLVFAGAVAGGQAVVGDIRGPGRRGDHNEARNTLTMALDNLHTTARRQRALLLVDLATAELHTGNLPDACAHATQAADLLHQTPYATGTARLRAFRAAAAQPMNTRALRVLDEQLRQLAA